MTTFDVLELTAGSLVLGDQVQLFPDPFGWGTVVKVVETTVDSLGEVHIFRPYVHIGDVEYSGGNVLHYIGTETVKLWRGDSRPLTVHGPTHARMTKEGAIK